MRCDLIIRDATVFDGTGTYDIAFAIMLGASVLAVALSAMLRQPASRAATL